jgi:hypothetical protein
VGDAHRDRRNELRAFVQDQWLGGRSDQSPSEAIELRRSAVDDHDELVPAEAGDEIS